MRRTEYRVLESWTASYPDSISLRKGDIVILTPETFDWEGHLWVWARSEDGREGWIPDDLAQNCEGVTRAREDFSAMELTCNEGEVLRVSLQRHGWAWCQNAESRSGWVPLRNLEALPSLPA